MTPKQSILENEPIKQELINEPIVEEDNDEDDDCMRSSECSMDSRNSNSE